MDFEHVWDTGITGALLFFKLNVSAEFIRNPIKTW